MIDSSVTYKSYFVGLALSIALTLSSYFFVTLGLFSTKTTYAAITIFAVSQVIVQIIYFLHIGGEAKPRWNLMSLIFALVTICILVVGSLWVMYNLNVNMM